MTAILTFSIIAASLVWLAGRKDAARDPHLTFLLLVLLALLPPMLAFMPKIGVLPAPSTSVTPSGFPWMHLVVTVWATGFVCALGKIILAATVIAHWRKKSVHLQTTAGVSVRSLDNLRSPVATGIFRKTVFVPTDWKNLPRTHRDIVLAHELAHHRRHDPLLRLCVEIVRAIHWWNPLVHWMARRHIMQSECACDQSVLRDGTDSRAYANILCDFAVTHPSNSLALAMADTSSLEKRVGRILAGKNHTGILLLAVLGTLGLTTACALSMLGNQPPVSPSEVELRLSANPFPAEP